MVIKKYKIFEVDPAVSVKQEGKKKIGRDGIG